MMAKLYSRVKPMSEIRMLSAFKTILISGKKHAPKPFDKLNWIGGIGLVYSCFSLKSMHVQITDKIKVTDSTTILFFQRIL